MRIGITGGIGSGKSHVARLLTHHYGIPVYDSDAEARRLMTSSDEIRCALTALIGTEAYRPDGSLNKQVVTRYLFASAAHAAQVNAIVHPAVKADFLRWAAAHSGIVVLESAILVEAGFRDAVDMLIVVSAPEELRIQRAMRRDGVGEEAVRARMARQSTEEARRAAADFVIENDGRDLLPQLRHILQTINHQEKEYNHA